MNAWKMQSKYTIWELIFEKKRIAWKTRNFNRALRTIGNEIGLLSFACLSPISFAHKTQTKSLECLHGQQNTNAYSHAAVQL